MSILATAISNTQSLISDWEMVLHFFFITTNIAVSVVRLKIHSWQTATPEMANIKYCGKYYVQSQQ